MINNQIILPENIVLNISIPNWQQAIHEAGSLLVNNGFTNKLYIQEMIDAVNEYGPYIVIAPGVALGHGRPSNNVLKTGISLITLSQPINFGSKDNDPVSIVFALCATDSTSHINILTQICSFMDRDEAISFLTNSNSSAEVAFNINNF